MRSVITAFLFLLGLAAASQIGSSVGRKKEGWEYQALDSLKLTLARDPASTIALTDRMISAFRDIRDRCALAEVYGLRSGSFNSLGKYDSALVNAQQVFSTYEASCDSSVLMRGYAAQSYLHSSLGEWHLVDSICDLGLAIWRPGRNSILRNVLLTNKAIAQVNQGDVKGAQSAFRRILGYAKMEGAEQDIHDANSNMGAIKTMLGELDSAEYFHRSALRNARENGRDIRIAVIYRNLSSLKANREDYAGALALLDSAMHYARLAKDLKLQATIEHAKSDDFRDMGDDASALLHFKTYKALEDSLLNLEKVKVLTEMQEKYESEKKANEILGLKADNLESELDKARVKRTRNIYLFSGLAFVGVAAGLLHNLRRTRRSRAAIQHEKEISEGLLHNILPEEVADEIRAKGFADVREFPTATVLFTDFKGFTLLSEKLSATELVAEIDHCFRAFDGIMERHGIEKIKTIGDAYMAAGGLPDPTKGSPLSVVMAALEMQQFMSAYKAERIAQGRLYFEMRLGVHTGPVIAGIVGVKKYAYDIWGDTVNTASRMESSGAVGQVNISASTHALVRDAALLRFTPRGLVEAKGKGPMEMFFVAQATS
jgi:adenylate cyclase